MSGSRLTVGAPRETGRTPRETGSVPREKAATGPGAATAAHPSGPARPTPPDRMPGSGQGAGRKGAAR